MSVMRDRRAVVLAGLSLVVLFGGSLGSLLLPADDQVLGVAAAVAGYIFCGQSALSRWHADDRVFSHPSRAVFGTFVADDERSSIKTASR